MLRTLFTLSSFGIYGAHGMSMPHLNAPAHGETTYISAGLAEALLKAGYTVNGTTGVSFDVSPDSSVDRYPDTIVAKWTEGISNGDGYDFHKARLRTTALEPFTGTIKDNPVSRRTEYHKYIVASAEDYADNMRATASADLRYETVSASVDASFERDVTYSSKDALFLIHGMKDFGFSGWESADTPRMSEFAQNILCPSGSDGPLQAQKFEEIFGTHYFIGDNKVTTLDITVQTTTQTSSSSNKVSASVHASWEEFAVDGGASASFSNTLKQSGSFTNIDVYSTTAGVADTFLGQPDIDHLEKTVDEYNEKSTHDNAKGTSKVLRSYEQHPDYVRASVRCQDNGKDMPSVDRDVLKMIVTVAVKARLMGDDILSREGAERADGCVWELARQALELYGELRVYTDKDVSLDALKSARKRMQALTDQWDDDSNRCQRKTSDSSCIEYGWDYFGNDLSPPYSPETVDNQDECQELCRVNSYLQRYLFDEEGCRYWTFNTANNVCYVKSSSAGRWIRDGFNSGARDCPQNTFYIFGDCSSSVGTNCPGGDWLGTGTSFGSCASLCPHGFVHATNGDLNCKCLKGTPTDAKCSRDEKDGTCTYIPKYPAFDASCVEFGWDYYGNDIYDVPASSNEECQERCLELKGCRYWTFGPSRGQCWLKSSNKGREKKDDHNSGARNCKSQRRLDMYQESVKDSAQKKLPVLRRLQM